MLARTRVRSAVIVPLIAIVAIATTASTPAWALQALEPKSRIAVDVPDAWTVEDKGEIVVAFPDKTFHLRLAGTAAGYADETQAEAGLLEFLNHHLKEVAVQQHGVRVDWNGYAGFETSGTGREQSGRAARWFALVLTDKTDPSRILVAVGTGTKDGYAKYEPVALDALHHLRSP